MSRHLRQSAVLDQPLSARWFEPEQVRVPDADCRITRATVPLQWAPRHPITFLSSRTDAAVPCLSATLKARRNVTGAAVYAGNNLTGQPVLTDCPATRRTQQMHFVAQLGRLLEICLRAYLRSDVDHPGRESDRSKRGQPFDPDIGSFGLCEHCLLETLRHLHDLFQHIRRCRLPLTGLLPFTEDALSVLQARAKTGIEVKTSAIASSRSTFCLWNGRAHASHIIQRTEYTQ